MTTPGSGSRAPVAAVVAAIVGPVVLAAIGLVARAAGPPAPSTPDGGAPSPNVKLIFQTVPPAKATVFWGKKSIGIINANPKRPRSLTIERPRDTGPMDIVVRAKDFLPVHTRAYTFNDTKVFVKLTPVEEKKSLFGYREEIPDAGAPEAGAPAAVVGPPAPDGGAR